MCVGTNLLAIHASLASLYGSNAQPPGCQRSFPNTGPSWNLWRATTWSTALPIQRHFKMNTMGGKRTFAADAVTGIGSRQSRRWRTMKVLIDLLHRIHFIGSNEGQSVRVSMIQVEFRHCITRIVRQSRPCTSKMRCGLNAFPSSVLRWTKPCDEERLRYFGLNRADQPQIITSVPTALPLSLGTRSSC